MAANSLRHYQARSNLVPPVCYLVLGIWNFPSWCLVFAISRLAPLLVRAYNDTVMIREYIETALQRAKYEIIEDDEPYYGEIPELPGVWATGANLEECRRGLADAVDAWVLFRLSQGMAVPALGKTRLKIPRRLKAGV